MTVEPAHDDHARSGPVPAIPHTINAIGEALSGTDRAAFYAQVLAAEEDDVAGIMRRWWKTAMLNRAPYAASSRANASAGRRLVPVTELADRLEQAAGA